MSGEDARQAAGIKQRIESMQAGGKAVEDISVALFREGWPPKLIRAVQEGRL